MLRKLTRFTLSFSLLATLLVGVSVATIAPAQAVATCAAGGVCAVGDTGPGGGTVFYASPSTFTCGPTLNLTCKYLEAAPNTWAGGSIDPTLEWSGNLTTSVSGAFGTAIGAGFKNTMAAIAISSVAEKAVTKTRAYTGGGLTDWYLPSKDELKELYLKQSYVGTFRTTPDIYVSSTQSSRYSDAIWFQYFNTSYGDDNATKDNIM
jgi:hypothetical protein